MGIDVDNRDALGQSLVLQESLELAEGPGMRDICESKGADRGACNPRSESTLWTHPARRRISPRPGGWPRLGASAPSKSSLMNPDRHM